VAVDVCAIATGAHRAWHDAETVVPAIFNDGSLAMTATKRNLNRAENAECKMKNAKC
jgi:hypothetical protein